ncbi:hypothetical protein MICAC_5010014 [Microcystis aeruginosa PCC 9443]|uniref:Uncharacterized protein n=1 Tax=Microcystis aeruginosa PCC 9443 TaxID=1160281 RepID=I4G7A6_MICAE|nr:hypothetical protein MICAC_5010014 [Microcystis aeruginosa PCC 9443]
MAECLGHFPAIDKTEQGGNWGKRPYQMQVTLHLDKKRCQKLILSDYLTLPELRYN